MRAGVAGVAGTCIHPAEALGAPVVSNKAALLVAAPHALFGWLPGARVPMLVVSMTAIEVRMLGMARFLAALCAMPICAIASVGTPTIDPCDGEQGSASASGVGSTSGIHSNAEVTCVRLAEASRAPFVGSSVLVGETGSGILPVTSARVLLDALVAISVGAITCLVPWNVPLYVATGAQGPCVCPAVAG